MPHRRSRARVRVAAIALLATLLVLGSACGDDNEGDDAGGPVPDSVGPEGDPGDGDPDGDEIPVLDGDVPPVNAVDIESLYGDALEELGMRLTPRGGLIDRSDGGYYQSSTGDHLALYVEPIADYSDQQYVDGIVEVSKVFAADAFDRWPGLASFDVCQEPLPEVDDRDEPIPVTQIELTRAQNDAIDWATVTVGDIWSAAQADPPGLRLVVSEALRESDEFQAATSG